MPLTVDEQAELDQIKALKSQREQGMAEGSSSEASDGLTEDEAYELKQIRELKTNAKYGGLGGAMAALTAGAANTLSLSGSDWLARGIGRAEDLKGLKEAHPVATAVGEYGAFLAPFLGEAGMALKGVEAVGKLAGAGAAKLATKEATKKIVQTGVGLGVEGGIFGLQQASSDAALGDHDLISSKTAASIGFGALTGGALGAALGKFMSRAAPEATMAEKVLGKEKPAEFITESAPGISKTPEHVADEVGARAMATENGMSEIDQSILNNVEPGEKLGFVKDFLRKKENAQEILDMNGRLGVETLPMQLAKDKIVQNIYDRAMRTPDAYGATLMQSVIDNAYKIKQKVTDVFTKHGQMGDEVAGALFKEKVNAKFSEMYKPYQDYFGKLKALGEDVSLSKEQLVDFHGRLATGLKEVGGAAAGPAENIYRAYMDQLLKQGSIENLMGLARQAGNDYSSFAARDAGGAMNNAEGAIAVNKAKQLIDEFVGEALMDHAKSRARSLAASVKNGLGEKLAAQEAFLDAKNLIKANKKIKAGYGEMKRDFSDVMEYTRLAKGDVTKGQTEAALKGVADEKMIQKAFDPKNAKGLQRLKEIVPEAFEVLKNAKKEHILRDIQKNVTGEMTFQKLHDAIFNEKIISRGVREQLFTPDELQLFKDATSWGRSFPQKLNTSGTSDAIALDKFLESLKPGEKKEGNHLGGIIGGLLPPIITRAANWVIDKGVESVSAAGMGILNEQILKGVQTQSALKQMESSFTSKMISSAKSILSEEKARSITAFSIGKAVTTEEYYKKMDEVFKFAHDPRFAMDKLDEITEPIADAAPGVAEAMKMQTIAAMDFLSSKLPISDTTDDIFSSEKLEPSNNEKQRFNRYYSIVDRPEQVFSAIKDGTLTNEHVEAISTVYPKLYQEMQQILMTEVANKKNKSKVPYRTRMMLSLFMGQSFDSSLKTHAIMTYQGHFAQANAEHETKASLPGMREMGMSNRLGLNGEDEDA